jgi:hypothetical protein
MQQIRLLATVSLVGTVAAQCHDRAPAANDAVVTTSGGNVLTDTLPGNPTLRALNYPVTADQYNRWTVAQRSLDNLAVPAPSRIRLRNYSDTDVDRAVRQIESSPDARLAVEASGLNVRDYVLTSLALAQALAQTGAGQRVRYLDLPQQNVEFVTPRRAAIERYQRGRYRVVDQWADENDDEGEHGNGQHHDYEHKNHHDREHGDRGDRGDHEDHEDHEDHSDHDRL